VVAIRIQGLSRTRTPRGRQAARSSSGESPRGGRSGIFGLLDSTEASTAVEYSLFLGLIGMLVIVGAFAIGAMVRNTAQNLTAASHATERVVAGNGAENSAVNVAAADAIATSRPKAPALALPWVFGGVAAALGLGCTWVWRLARRKMRPAEPDQEVPLAVPNDCDLQARVYAKRHGLLLALTNDRGLLAENQIAVRHLMSPNPLVVSPQTPVAELHTLMTDNRIHHLLVCEQEDRLVGVLSDRDLHRRLGKTAGDIMTPNPCSVTPDTMLSPAISCLINRRISCLPVVREGRVCGVITTVDMVLMTQCVLQLLLKLARDLNASATWPEALIRAAEAEFAEDGFCLTGAAEPGLAGDAIVLA
jgi:CBS domain-containing protein